MDRIRNFFPICLAPRRNSGTFSMILMLLMDKPNIYSKTIARPDTPPNTRLWLAKNVLIAIATSPTPTVIKT